jgi:3-(3-hydroxy-phenyl)propionate hydroxylase
LISRVGISRNAFLIADVEMQADFPSERWFWFTANLPSRPVGAASQAAGQYLPHRFAAGARRRPGGEKKPENVIPRIEKVVGGRPFKLDWVSVYSFNCRRIDRFVHDRVIFIGDSAHVVSPFGARGGNGGMHDVDNLCWKLAHIINGTSDASLLDSYDAERVHGADENIRNSSWTSRFMSPEPGIEMSFRNAVLSLAVDTPFARRMVNAGRLSVPCQLDSSDLNSHDSDEFDVAMQTGMVCLDAPVRHADGRDDWLMRQIGGGFCLLATGGATIDPATLPDGITVIEIGSGRDGSLEDTEGLVAARYGRGVHLIRPDQHLAARWAAPTPGDITSALARCARIAA